MHALIISPQVKVQQLGAKSQYISAFSSSVPTPNWSSQLVPKWLEVHKILILPIQEEIQIAGPSVRGAVVLRQLLEQGQEGISIGVRVRGLGALAETARRLVVGGGALLLLLLLLLRDREGTPFRFGVHVGAGGGVGLRVDGHRLLHGAEVEAG